MDVSRFTGAKEHESCSQLEFVAKNKHYLGNTNVENVYVNIKNEVI